MLHWAHHRQSPHLPIIQRPRFHLPPRFARLLRRARISRRSSRSATADDGGGSVTPALEASTENHSHGGGSVTPALEASTENHNDGGGSVTPVPEASPENLRNAGGGGGASSSSSDSESGVGSGVNRLFGRKKPVHSVFGAGKPADVVLWRNKKISGGVLAGATAVWVLFELLDYHLLTLVCQCLIISLAVLFLWATANTFINKSPSCLPEEVIPEDATIKVALAIRFEINRAFKVLREIASGRDLRKFLGVIAALWILSVVGSWCSFLTLFYIVFILLQTVPVVYEKYEDQVDTFAEKALAGLKKQYAVFDAKVLSKIPRGRLKDKKL